jgi:hypothetical protein
MSIANTLKKKAMIEEKLSKYKKHNQAANLPTGQPTIRLTTQPTNQPTKTSNQPTKQTKTNQL